MTLSAVFAIPGDMHRRTGGFIYESTVLAELRALGHEIRHLRLPASFPDPDATDIARTAQLLRAVPAGIPILLDGLVPGAMGSQDLAGITAPLVPVIHHPLGLETGLSSERAKALIEGERAALRHAARIVVPSPHTARLLVELFHLDPAAIDIAPPGFDPVEGARSPIQPPLILSVGLLTARKGHDVLVEALARLRDLQWQSQIVGAEHDAGFAAALRARVEDLGLADRIAIRGLLPASALAQAYAQASVFALATRYEGYGIVLGEAMQRGLPIVTCRVGAVPETVGDAALLVAPDEPGALAGALRAVLTDPALRGRLAEASARAGQRLPRWRETAERIAASLRSVIGPQRGIGPK